MIFILSNEFAFKMCIRDRKKGDNFQARATWQSVADGYSPADDGIVDEAKARIAKLN